MHSFFSSHNDVFHPAGGDSTFLSFPEGDLIVLDQDRASRSWRPAGLTGSTTEASREETSLQTVSMCCPQSLDLRLTSWYWSVLSMFRVFIIAQCYETLSMTSRLRLWSSWHQTSGRSRSGCPCSCNRDEGEDEALHAGVLLRLLQVNDTTSVPAPPPVLLHIKCLSKKKKKKWLLLIIN